MAKKKSASTMNCCAPYAPSKAEQDRWQAESDVQTLLRAAEIRKDPARIKRARALAAEQAAALKQAQS